MIRYNYYILFKVLKFVKDDVVVFKEFHKHAPL